MSDNARRVAMDNPRPLRFGVVMPNTELLTAQQVAERLSVHVESVRRWTRQGDLAAVRLPSGRYRYREEDVTALVTPDAA